MSQCCPSRSRFCPLPGHRRILQTLPASTDSAPTARLDSLWVWGCPVLTRHPGLGLCFVPQVTREGRSRAGAELRGSHKHLCAALWADSSSAAKDSGCCKPALKESSILWQLGILSPLGSTGQKHTHSSRGSTPSHSIQPELLGLLGHVFA